MTKKFTASGVISICLVFAIENDVSNSRALHWTMPEAIDEYLVYIGNVSTPMAMIYIGSTLAGCSMLEILKDHIVIEGTLNKLIILPLLTYVLVILLPVDPLIKAMLILGC